MPRPQQTYSAAASGKDAVQPKKDAQPVFEAVRPIITYYGKPLSLFLTALYFSFPARLYQTENALQNNEEAQQSRHGNV